MKQGIKFRDSSVLNLDVFFYYFWHSKFVDKLYGRPAGY